MLIVSGLNSVIDSHTQLTTVIYRTVVNQATSMTNLVLEGLVKLMDIVGTDVASSQLFLDTYQVSYRTNMAYFVQNISGQLIYSNQQLENWLHPNLQMGYPEAYKILKNLTATVKSSLSSAKDFLTNKANFLEIYCSSSIHAIYDKSDSIFEECDLDASNRCGGILDINYLIPLLQGVQSSISEVINCIAKYEEDLSTFQSFLDSVDQTVPSVDMSVATRTMNKLFTDGIWLESLLVDYQNGSRTKRSLSDVFLRASNNRVLLNVERAVSGVELSVLSLLSSTISTIETRTISIYSQLITCVYKIQTFMPIEDTAPNNFSRQLFMWKSLFPMLLDKNVSTRHFNRSIDTVHVHQCGRRVLSGCRHYDYQPRTTTSSDIHLRTIIPKRIAYIIIIIWK